MGKNSPTARDPYQDVASRVVVVIVNFNSGTFLARSVAALQAQTYRAFTTIVVDNASTDDSVAVMQKGFPEIEVIRAPGNLGFAAGNNLAIRECRDCHWLVLLNPDAFPEPDWLRHLMEAAQAHRQYSSFASQVVFDSDPRLLDGAGDEYHLSGFAWRRLHRCPVTMSALNLEVFAPSATAALYRRDAFDEAGGFDERYFCYYEDVDLGLRLKLLGHRTLYVPGAVVRHVGSGVTGRRSAFVTYHTQRNRIWTYVKNMPSPWVWILLPLHLFYQGVVMGLYATQGQLGPALRGTLDALRGMGPTLDARSVIQRTRRINFLELARAMRRGVFAPIFRK
jgi:GT2 family glycosyltransferase